MTWQSHTHYCIIVQMSTACTVLNLHKRGVDLPLQSNTILEYMPETDLLRV